MRDTGSPCSKLTGVEVMGPGDLDRRSRSGKECHECLCSSCRAQDTRSQSLVTIGITLLMFFCVLLFLWNILLWRKIDGMQGSVTALEGKVLEQEHVISRLSERRAHSDRIARRRHRHRTEKVRATAPPQMKLSSDGAVRDEPGVPSVSPAIVDPSFSTAAHRVKRSGPVDDEESPGAASGRASRDRASRKRGRGGGRQKKPKGRKKRLPPAVAIHVPVQMEDPYPGKVVPDQIIHDWSTDPDMNQGFSVQDINGDPGGVQIMTPGVYFVYSQIVFKMSKGREITEKIMTGVIGNSELSACTNSFPSTHDEDDYISCYTSGITRLERGERIRVRISPPGIQVFMSPAHSYFGAFLIGV